MSQEGRHSDYRFERKFKTDQLGFQELEQIVRRHPACFSEIFRMRRVHNIYFDTPDLSFFSDNVAGRTNRLKVRIRWYGNDSSQITMPVLEFKRKNGLVGNKTAYRLQDFCLTDVHRTQFFDHLFSSSDLPQDVLEQLKGLEPTLMNGYMRKYFLSFNRDFRVTLDTNMVFYDFRSFWSRAPLKIEDSQNNILELKYDQSKDSDASGLVTTFPFRITKSSKYVSGLFLIRPDLVG